MTVKEFNRKSFAAKFPSMVSRVEVLQKGEKTISGSYEFTRVNATLYVYKINELGGVQELKLKRYYAADNAPRTGAGRPATGNKKQRIFRLNDDEFGEVKNFIKKMRENG